MRRRRTKRGTRRKRRIYIKIVSLKDTGQGLVPDNNTVYTAMAVRECIPVQWVCTVIRQRPEEQRHVYGQSIIFPRCYRCDRVRYNNNNNYHYCLSLNETLFRSLFISDRARPIKYRPTDRPHDDGFFVFFFHFIHTTYVIILYTYNIVLLHRYTFTYNT